MFRTTTAPVAARAVRSGGSAGALRDYLELAKPRITAMVLVTTAAGFLLGTRSLGLSAGAVGGATDSFTEQLSALFNLLLGTALVAAGTSAMNHVLERDVDGLMARTRHRPLPAGRLEPGPARVLAGVLAGAGVLYLAATVNLLTASLAAATFVIYDFVYTPLKRISSLATLVGAVPGALPVLGGWTAATGGLGPGGMALFGIMFVWQIPHFLALAWILRSDYAAAGMPMLGTGQRGRGSAGRSALTFSLALLPMSLLPALLGLGGAVYAATAVALGGGLLVAAAVFFRRATLRNARMLFRLTILYVPLLFGVLALNTS